MAAANASARGQRAAILASPLHELTGFYLAVDCLAPRCNGERTFAVAELATFYGRDSTVDAASMHTNPSSPFCAADQCSRRVEQLPRNLIHNRAGGLLAVRKAVTSTP